MIVECSFNNLLTLIGRRLSIEELEETLFLIKAEIEGHDGDTIEIEINPDRQDMLSPEGIARAVRSFLGITPGLTEFETRKSGHEVLVKPGLSKIRPYISCGIVRGISTDDELIKDYMHLQEALTSTHGRNRKKASIGLYVHRDIRFPVVYCAKKPESIGFVPLGHDQMMDGPTIIREHEKGVLYGSIISSNKKWPLLIDSANEVLSLPPIINSNSLGRVDTDTRDIFVEVTGTHLPTVNQALNIMIASLAERGGVVETVSVKYPDGSIHETPDLKPWIMKVAKDDITELIGIELSDDEIIQSLTKMGYGAKIQKSGVVKVSVPSYRTDVLHAVDVIEDTAIGYGFNNIEPSIPQSMTAGKLQPITRLMTKARDLMVGVGYQEVMTYVMTSPDTHTSKMRRDDRLIVTMNPKSRDYSVLRNSLLPALIDFGSRNQHADFPQRIFEVGFVVVPDDTAETRSRQSPRVGGIHFDNRVNLTKLMSELSFVLRNLGLEDSFSYEARSNKSFIEGRSGIIIVNGKERGTFGELSPEVLNAFGITKPVIGFEIELPLNTEW
ncbi:MAG: phenylalanine--tRNA ligase subunit beta [Candidatus Thorarchaeota archaeon]|jgi:phenylalanyl-tRNA synthetase beta chain